MKMQGFTGGLIGGLRLLLLAAVCRTVMSAHYNPPNTACRKCVVEIQDGLIFCQINWGPKCEKDSKKDQCKDKCPSTAEAAPHDVVRELLLTETCRVCVAEKVDNDDFCRTRWDKFCDEAAEDPLCKNDCQVPQEYTNCPYSPNPCMNGGVCYTGYNKKFGCACAVGYVGETCDLGPSADCRVCAAGSDGSPYCLYSGWDSRCQSESYNQVCINKCHVNDDNAVEQTPDDYSQLDTLESEDTWEPTTAQSYNDLCKQCVAKFTNNDWCLSQWDSKCEQYSRGKTCHDTCWAADNEALVVDSDDSDDTEDDYSGLPDATCRECVAVKVANGPYCLTKWDDICAERMKNPICRSVCEKFYTDTPGTGGTIVGGGGDTAAEDCASCKDAMKDWCVNNYLGDKCTVIEYACKEECAAAEAEGKTLVAPGNTCRTCVEEYENFAFCKNKWDEQCEIESYYVQCAEDCGRIAETALECTACKDKIKQFCKITNLDGCDKIEDEACSKDCTVSA